MWRKARYVKSGKTMLRQARPCTGRHNCVEAGETWWRQARLCGGRWDCASGGRRLCGGRWWRSRQCVGRRDSRLSCFWVDGGMQVGNIYEAETRHFTLLSRLSTAGNGRSCFWRRQRWRWSLAGRRVSSSWRSLCIDAVAAPRCFCLGRMWARWVVSHCIFF